MDEREADNHADSSSDCEADAEADVFPVISVAMSRCRISMIACDPSMRC